MGQVWAVRISGSVGLVFRVKNLGSNQVGLSRWVHFGQLEVSYMFLGKKVDWDNHGTYSGMMDTCCTKWDPSKRQKKYIKSGRRT